MPNGILIEHRRFVSNSRNTAMATKDLILITGGSGYLGSYCIEALNQGYCVRTTRRSLRRKDDVK